MSARVDFAFLRAVRSPTGPATKDQRLVALVVGLRSDRGEAWLSREEIGDEALLGSVATRKALRELKASGWLTEEHQAGRSRWMCTVPTGTPNALDAARERRRRAPTKPINGSKAGDQSARRLQDGDGSSARRLGDHRLEGLEIIGSKAPPSGSTPKTTPADKPQKKDPKRDLKPGLPALDPRDVPREEPGQLRIPGIAVPDPKPIDPLHAPEVTEVLEHWRSRGYHTRPVADTPERRRRIRDRLDEGLGAETLKAAIDGASLDDWLMGRHPRNDASTGGKVYKGLETILRDAAQVEKLSTIWDVALAEGRVHPDGGDRLYDRFGNPRIKRPEPVTPPPSGPAEAPIGREEAERRFAAMAADYEARKQAARDVEAKANEQRRAALTPDQRAEEDFLLAAQRRGEQRIAEQEALEDQRREQRRAAAGWN